MKTIEDFQRIVDYVNSFSEVEDVHCTVIPLDGCGITKSRKLYDIELMYKGYYYVERFNSDMSFETEDESRIAVSLLRNLFVDYFEMVKEYKTKGKGE